MSSNGIKPNLSLFGLHLMSIKTVIKFTQMYVKVSKHALQSLLRDETGGRRRTNRPSGRIYVFPFAFRLQIKNRQLEIHLLADLSGSGAAAE